MNNIDYMIIQKFELQSNYYDFNHKFDIVYMKVERERDYNRNKYQNKYNIYFQTFSGIINNSKSHNLSYDSEIGRPQFFDDSHFFYFCNHQIKL